jgi:hypothetical protein
VFDALGVSSVPLVFAKADLQRSCRVTMYVLAESHRELLSFVPAEVEVHALCSTPVVFWPGSSKALVIAGAHAKTASASKAGSGSSQQPLEPPSALPLQDGADDGDPLAEDLLPWVQLLERDVERIAAEEELDEPPPAPRRRPARRASQEHSRSTVYRQTQV